MKNFALIMSFICLILFSLRLTTIDYSNFLTLENIFNLLLPTGLLYIFLNRYFKEKNKQKDA